VSDEAPKRLSLAEKRAMARPLFLDEAARIEDTGAAADLPADWTRAVAPDQMRKTLISLRVDPEVLAFFKAQGPGYQTRMNAVLTAYMQVKKEMGQG
jgi:uncharacterized protein (DUF4415 family)